MKSVIIIKTRSQFVKVSTNSVKRENCLYLARIEKAIGI